MVTQAALRNEPRSTKIPIAPRHVFISQRRPRMLFASGSDFCSLKSAELLRTLARYVI
jgi:hypothetical protein